MKMRTAKKWCNEEHREFLVQLKKRNLIRMYGGKPALLDTAETADLAQHLNSLFDRKRSAKALCSRFVKMRNSQGWPEAYENYMASERIDLMNENQTKARTDSDNGWIMIDVAKFQSLYSGRNSYDVNECLMRARVDQ